MIHFCRNVKELFKIVFFREDFELYLIFTLQCKLHIGSIIIMSDSQSILIDIKPSILFSTIFNNFPMFTIINASSIVG